MPDNDVNQTGDFVDVHLGLVRVDGENATDEDASKVAKGIATWCEANGYGCNGGVKVVKEQSRDEFLAGLPKDEKSDKSK